MVVRDNGSVRRAKRKSTMQGRRLFKKRRVTKRDSSRRGNNPQTIARFRGYGFPDTLRANLAYSESIVLAASITSVTPYVVFSMNSAYDPNNSGGGGQPYYYDQFAALYTNYKVLGAKCTAIFSRTQDSTATVGPWIVGLHGSGQNTLPTSDTGQLITSTNCNWGMLTPQSDQCQVVSTYSPKQAFGNEFSGEVGAAVGANPAVNWFVKPFMAPQGASITSNVNVTIVIDFLVEFTGLKNVTPS